MSSRKRPREEPGAPAPGADGHGLETRSTDSDLGSDTSEMEAEDGDSNFEAELEPSSGMRRRAAHAARDPGRFVPPSEAGGSGQGGSASASLLPGLQAGFRPGSSKPARDADPGRSGRQNRHIRAGRGAGSRYNGSGSDSEEDVEAHLAKRRARERLLRERLAARLARIPALRMRPDAALDMLQGRGAWPAVLSFLSLRDITVGFAAASHKCGAIVQGEAAPALFSTLAMTRGSLGSLGNRVAKCLPRMAGAFRGPLRGHLRRLELQRAGVPTPILCAALTAMRPLDGLTHINLSGNEALSDSVLHALGAGTCPQLRELILFYCTGLRDVSALARGGCPRLRHIDFAWCTNLDPDSFSSFARGTMHALEHINLYQCLSLTDDVLVALGSGHCPQLRTVVVSHCLQIGDRGISGLSAGGCPRLRVLHMSNCAQVSDAALRALGDGACLELEDFNANDCVKIGDTGVRALARGCPRLRVLLLTACARVTDESLCLLGSGALRRLESAKVSACPRVTDAGLTALARACSTLQHLDIHGCELVGDAGIVALATGACSGLRRVVFTRCPRITGAGLRAFARGGLNALEEVRVGGPGSPLKAEEIVDTFRQHCPRVTSLMIDHVNAFEPVV